MNSREQVIKKIREMIRENGFDPDQVRTLPFYKLEEMTEIGHHKILGGMSQKKIDELFRYLLNYS